MERRNTSAETVHYGEDREDQEHGGAGEDGEAAGEREQGGKDYGHDRRVANEVYSAEDLREDALAAHAVVEIDGQTTNDEGTLDLVRETKPDVVVMQVQMPLARARENLLKMRRVEPPSKVVLCIMFEDPVYVHGLLEMGASAYLVKSASAEHLIGAIRVTVRLPGTGMLRREVSVWEAERNRAGASVEWRFTAHAASTKPRKLYPSVEP